MSQYETTVMSLTLAGEMESRGRDSFGGVGIPTEYDEDKLARIIRGIGKVSESGKELFKLAASSRSFLGHTRAATKGSICIDNSHPFRIGDVLGVHNGVITNHDHLNQKYNRKFAVDSMHAFAHIDEKRDLTDLWGYGTLFWLRSSENWANIYFAKTNGGSLTVAKLFREKDDAEEQDDNHFAVVWASEQRAIERVCGLLGFTFNKVSIEENTIHKIVDGCAYTLKTPFSFGSHYKGRGYVSVEEAEDENNLWNQSWWNRDNPTKPSGCKIPNKEKHLSRRERKALKKARLNQKKEAFRKDWVADPIAENIYSGYNMKVCYVPDPETQGKTDKQYLCPECECLIKDHDWGMCTNNNIPNSSCKAKSPHIACDIPQASLCGDCGHFLVEGVHGQSVGTGMYKIVECYQCHNYCAPETMIVNADNDDAKEPEMTDEKTTEIILAVSKSNPYDTVEEARKKLFLGPVTPSDPT